jgi:hypothetical protein
LILQLKAVPYFNRSANFENTGLTIHVASFVHQR